MAERLEIEIVAKDKASGTLKKLSKSIGGLGIAAAGAAGAAGVAALGVALGSSVSKAAEFERSMSRVGALSGATSDQLSKLSTVAQELGSTTAFTSTQAAEGMQFLAMAGFEVNDVVAAMPGLLSTAAAGQIELGEAADITSNILTGFQLSASETSRVADVLTATFTSSNVNLAMLGESMKFVAPIASELGISLEEASAAVGILGNAGIQGSMAGTALRTSLLHLAAPTARAKELMADLGIAVFDQQGKLLPLTDILTNVSASMAGMTDAQQAAALKTLVGTEALSGFQVLLGSVADQSLPAFIAKLQESGGTADTIANQQLNNFEGQVTMLKSALDGLGVQIGSALLPLLTTLAQQFTAFIQQHGPAISQIFQTFASNLSGTVQPAMILIGDAMVRIADVFGLANDETTGIDVALGALATTLNLVVTAIQSLAIAAQLVASAFEAFKPIIDDVKQSIDKLTSGSIIRKLEGLGRLLSPGGVIARAAPKLLGFSQGGIVPGRTGQPTLAMVHGGERILTPQQQRTMNDNRTFNLNFNSPVATDPVQSFQMIQALNGAR